MHSLKVLIAKDETEDFVNESYIQICQISIQIDSMIEWLIVY